MTIIKCPNCKSPLLQQVHSYQCSNKHSFDISKEGYTNLILAHQKKKLNSGDNISMIKSRDAFLSSGHYDFLIKKIEAIITSKKSVTRHGKQNKTNLLDLGCGSGYYTRNLLDTFSNIDKIGIDVSKSGITIAAKKDKRSNYFVASIYNIPLVDSCIDTITNIFAPSNLEELSRVLKVNGIYIKVIPHNNHMREIAELVYKEFKPHSSDIEIQLNKDRNFRVIDTQEVILQKKLASIELKNLISMTPYVYKFQEEQLENLREMSVTFSFKIIVAQKIMTDEK